MTPFNYKDKPEAWNMRMVLGISDGARVIGVDSRVGLFIWVNAYLSDRAVIKHSCI